uniref:Secreted protein n=1 Tax=Cacopsylla melanoneura TaxID=428564 RepID=A0A8D8TK85_9HEMI
MWTRVIQLLGPTAFYLIIAQCRVCDGVENSSSIKWINVDMTKNLWPGISDLIGKVPCANGTDYCNDMATIVKRSQNANALRVECEQDVMVKNPNETLRNIC